MNGVAVTSPTSSANIAVPRKVGEVVTKGIEPKRARRFVGFETLPARLLEVELDEVVLVLIAVEELLFPILVVVPD